MSSGRIPCIVPFCRCTAAADKHPPHTEIICAKHWRPVSAATKARYRYVKRRRDRIWRILWGPTVPPPGRGRAYEMAQRSVDATWERCKAEAIEKAAGI